MSSQYSTMPGTGRTNENQPAMSGWQRIRRDKPWWLLPVTVVAVLGGFTIFGLWSALTPGHSEYGPYLSPFYSPKVLVGRTPISPAFWVLWSPLAFRATCYYYRKAYYRSFFWDPPACTIGELRQGKYRGESAFPLILNNLHRFFLYFALAVLAYLWWDVFQAFTLNGHLYLGLGTLLMTVNVVLLSAYTFSCHSLRHLVGGGLDCFSCVRGGKARHSTWKFLSVLNGRHAAYAWLSLFSVLSVDIYIRMLNGGWFVDPHWLIK